jgi:sugar phosphate isomerase/epimerase
MKRRDFIQTSAGTLAAAAMFTQTAKAEVKGKFDISVAAWSWHKMFFSGEIKMIDQIDLTKKAGATGLEMVNQFFASPMNRYLQDLTKKADSEGIKLLLIMIDGETDMNSPELKTRNQAIIDHRKWIDIAAVLGCHSVRCNAGYFSENITPEDSMKYAAESFTTLSDYAMQYNMNVIIENHGGLSSDPDWLVGLMKAVGKSNFGTLPDFGNFPNDGKHNYSIDIYDAVNKMMPYAKAYSAKCFDFDENGNETKIDFGKMMEIAFNHNYNGFVGVEYEGNRLGELEGIDACVKLLQRFQD